jgi:hypothetical protein
MSRSSTTTRDLKFFFGLNSGLAAGLKGSTKAILLGRNQAPADGDDFGGCFHDNVGVVWKVKRSEGTRRGVPKRVVIAP